jgi:hypothetical protein
MADGKEIWLQGLDWFIQRSPTAMWNNSATMYRLSPIVDTAYQDYLRALSAAGFDKVLQRIAEHFGFNGLTAYHLSVIAVNRCENREIDVDATNTGEKVLNAIIPLILAKETTGPEFQFEFLRDYYKFKWGTVGKEK